MDTLRPGKWPIEVSCEKADSRAVLKTSFEVRCPALCWCPL